MYWPMYRVGRTEKKNEECHEPPSNHVMHTQVGDLELADLQ